MHSSVGFRMTSTSPVLWNKSHLYSHHIQQAWQNLKSILILFSSNLSISNLCVNFINIGQKAFLTLENNRHKVLTVLCYLSKKKEKDGEIVILVHSPLRSWTTLAVIVFPERLGRGFLQGCQDAEHSVWGASGTYSSLGCRGRSWGASCRNTGIPVIFIVQKNKYIIEQLLISIWLAVLLVTAIIRILYYLLWNF